MSTAHERTKSSPSSKGRAVEVAALRARPGRGDGAGDLQFSGPEGVCVDAGEAGLVYVADVYKHRVIYDHSTRV